MKKDAHGVSGLNPNFEMAAFEGLYSELHLGELESPETTASGLAREREKKP